MTVVLEGWDRKHGGNRRGHQLGDWERERIEREGGEGLGESRKGTEEEVVEVVRITISGALWKDRRGRSAKPREAQAGWFWRRRLAGVWGGGRRQQWLVYYWRYGTVSILVWYWDYFFRNIHAYQHNYYLCHFMSYTSFAVVFEFLVDYDLLNSVDPYKCSLLHTLIHHASHHHTAMHCWVSTP